MKTILIVDDDLGFAFWLGQALDRAGFETWPAQSIVAAKSLLAEVKLAVDLLVIATSLPRASSFAAELGRGKADFKVIAVHPERGEGVEPIPDATVIRKKPPIIDTNARLEWVQLVRNLVATED